MVTYNASQLVNPVEDIQYRVLQFPLLTVMKILHLTPGTGSVMVASDVLSNANGTKSLGPAGAPRLTVSQIQQQQFLLVLIKSQLNATGSACPPRERNDILQQQ